PVRAGVLAPLPDEACAHARSPDAGVAPSPLPPPRCRDRLLPCVPCWEGASTGRTAVSTGIGRTARDFGRGVGMRGRTAATSGCLPDWHRPNYHPLHGGRRDGAPDPVDAPAQPAGCAVGRVLQPLASAGFVSNVWVSTRSISASLTSRGVPQPRFV